MKTYTFFAQGNPKGQPRARAVAFGGRARMYDPGTSNDWKACVKRAAHDAGATNARLSGAIELILKVQFPRPKGHFRSGKNAHLLRPDAPRRHTSTPDLDNAMKAVMDALNDAFVWGDDRQVCRCVLSKIYDAEPGAHITIRQIEDTPSDHH